jgi:hypothetical protein
VEKGSTKTNFSKLAQLLGLEVVVVVVDSLFDGAMVDGC